MKYLLAVLFIFIGCSSFSQGHDMSYYILNAKRNNPLVSDYQNQILSLQLDSQILKASLGFQVNFLSMNSYAPIFKGWGYDPAITNIANVSGLIQASRNFLSRGNIMAQYRTIALQRQGLIDTILLSGQDLIRTITDQYITAYGDLLVLDFNKEVYELMKQEEAVLKKLTQASVYKQTDYLTFYVTMQQQELLFLQGQIQYNSDYLTLNYLSGIIDTTIERIEQPSLSDTVNTDFFNSVFYRRFVTDSLRLNNERDLIDFQYRPKIGTYADAGYNSSLQYNAYRNFGFSAGISLIIPIYDGRQKQMRQAQIDTRERTRQINRDFYVKQYRMQVELLKRQLVSIDTMVKKINEQIEYSHTLILANGKLLQTGDITMKDYVTAINNYLTARNLLTLNNVNRLKILNQIAYWNIKP